VNVPEPIDYFQPRKSRTRLRVRWHWSWLIAAPAALVIVTSFVYLMFWICALVAMHFISGW